MTGVAPDAMPREIDSDSETNATVAAGARLCRMAARIGIGPVAVFRMPSIGPFISRPKPNSGTSKNRK